MEDELLRRDDELLALRESYSAQARSLREEYRQLHGAHPHEAGRGSSSSSSASEKVRSLEAQVAGYSEELNHLRGELSLALSAARDAEQERDTAAARSAELVALLKEEKRNSAELLRALDSQASMVKETREKDRHLARIR